eukprot:25954-Rhodomonas_salina.3
MQPCANSRATFPATFFPVPCQSAPAGVVSLLPTEHAQLLRREEGAEEEAKEEEYEDEDEDEDEDEEEEAPAVCSASCCLHLPELHLLFWRCLTWSSSLETLRCSSSTTRRSSAFVAFVLFPPCMIGTQQKSEKIRRQQEHSCASGFARALAFGAYLGWEVALSLPMVVLSRFLLRRLCHRQLLLKQPDKVQQLLCDLDHLLRQVPVAVFDDRRGL